MTTQPKTNKTPPGDISIRQQPVPTSREVFTANGKTYAKLTFPEGLNLKQVIDATEGMKTEGWAMLTRTKAREIRDNPESNTAFKNALKEGEWTYVRDPEAESRSLAAYLCHYGFDWTLCVNGYGWPDYVSRVVVLEKTGSEAAVPQIAIRTEQISDAKYQIPINIPPEDFKAKLDLAKYELERLRSQPTMEGTAGLVELLRAFETKD